MWSKMGGQIYPTSNDGYEKHLSKGTVYKMVFHPQRGIGLEPVSGLEMPAKMYGLCEDFHRRVLHAYETLSKKSLACILSGIRGAGKTVTCKAIALSAGNPIILLDNTDGSYFDFIESIDQDVTIIMDEMEKLYSDKNEASWVPILSALDGTGNSKYKRLWLLTCNGVSVNENMLDRLGRVRYHRKFVGLSKEQIAEVVTDQLPHLGEEEHKSTISALMRLSMRTVDSVVGYCQEVKLFGNTDPKWVMNDFNLSTKAATYMIKCSPLAEDGSPTTTEYELGPIKEGGPFWAYFEPVAKNALTQDSSHTLKHPLYCYNNIGNFMGVGEDGRYIYKNANDFSSDLYDQTSFIKGNGLRWSTHEEKEAAARRMESESRYYLVWAEEVEEAGEEKKFDWSIFKYDRPQITVSKDDDD